MKNKIKIVILLVFVLIICGCEAEYTLTIDNDNYYSEFTVQEYKTKVAESDNQFQQDIYAGDDKFNKEVIDDDLMTGATYSYKYSLEKFKSSTNFKQCFSKSSITSSNQFIHINTKEYIQNCGFGCFHEVCETIVSPFTISIVTNHKVERHNADSVSGNKYTWDYSKGSGKDIEFVYYKKEFVDKGNDTSSTSQTSSTNNKAEEQNPIVTLAIVGGVLVAFILAIFVIIKVKSQKN